MDIVEDIADPFRQLVKRVKGEKTEQFGRIPKTKVFFRDRDADDSNTIAYTEHIPVLFPDAKKEKNDGFSILKFTDRRNGLVFDRYPSLQTGHIRIQSSFLCKELQSVLKLYDIDSEDGYVDIFRPFEPLFFHRQEIYRRSQQFEERTEEREQFDNLIKDILIDDLGDLIKEIDVFERENKITWQLLWALFPRNSIAIAREYEGHEQAYQVLRTEYAEDNGTPLFFDIRCQYVHFNGLHYGFVEKDQTIPYFTGKKPITDLDLYPLRLAEKSKHLRQTFLTRGKKVLSYQDIHHVQIKPVSIDNTRPNFDELLKDLGRGHVHGRAIVDFYTAAKRNDKWNKVVKPLYEVKDSVMPSGTDMKGKGKAVDTEIDERIRHITLGVDGGVQRPSKATQQTNMEMVMLEEDNLVLMCPLLHAFSLQSRNWVNVNVEAVESVTFHDAAFNHLVADPNHKSILLALVEDQKHSFDIPGDPIPEKGKGLLILLSGPPGTGKTLMTEAIAERAKRPLYYIDARDLGTHAIEIASNFKIIMANACEWNAIVLLDECDIYLQQRSPTAHDGNDRVTAFLHQLEYFQGILFLTTNLFETLDPAVESRIHIHLPFKALPVDYRIEIWKHFLAPVPGPKLKEEELKRLALWSINGRQIKNAFRMTLALCRQQNRPVDFEILEYMIGLTSPQARKESPGSTNASVAKPFTPFTPFKTPTKSDRSFDLDSTQENGFLTTNDQSSTSTRKRPPPKPKPAKLTHTP